jgi:hypothetical protein
LRTASGMAPVTMKKTPQPRSPLLTRTGAHLLCHGIEVRPIVGQGPARAYPTNVSNPSVQRHGPPAGRSRHVSHPLA